MSLAQIFRDHVASRNDAFSHTHKPSIKFTDFPNTKAMMILSCMDPRANPTEIFDFHEGSPIVPGVLRNGGGRVTEDVLMSIRTLSGIMGNGENTVGLVAVVHHEDCGLRNFTNERTAEKLIEHAGLEGERADEVRRMNFGSWVK
jgi:carbonic anhydrase